MKKFYIMTVNTGTEIKTMQGYSIGYDKELYDNILRYVKSVLGNDLSVLYYYAEPDEKKLAKYFYVITIAFEDEIITNTGFTNEVEATPKEVFDSIYIKQFSVAKEHSVLFYKVVKV